MPGKARAEATAQERAPGAQQETTYIPLYRSLIHEGARYRTVSKDAQLAFVTLKLLMPCENIGRHVSWAAEIADNSGLTEEEARAGLEELRDAGMIHWDGRVLWIVQGFAHDPSMRGTISGRFAIGVAGRVRNLPDCAITREFKTRYAALFVAADEEKARQAARKAGSPADSPTDTPIGKASTEASGVRCTVQSAGVKGKKGTKSGSKTKAATPAPAQPTPWVAKATLAWRETAGGHITPQRIERELAPLVKEHGEERVLEVWDSYLAGCPVQFLSVRSFVERFGAYAAQLDEEAAAPGGDDYETTLVL